LKSAPARACLRRFDAMNPAKPETMLNRLGLQPHRIGLIVFAAIMVAWMAFSMRWDWLPQYGPALLEGIWVSIWMLLVTSVLGFILAVPIGLVQVTGPWWLSAPAKVFCTIIRGTPLLLQLWLLYYGLGSLFAAWPEIRQSWAWPYLRTAWPYGVAALTISFAAYEAEVMRGAFAGVPKGELEAARAFGMSPFTAFRRIWLPRAIHRALPTLNGETVLQLKSTPLVATITVVDAYAVISRVRQDTFLTYEPLLLLALIYMILTGILVLAFRKVEALVPVKGA
jgi:polar amino acid transport system permease protein